MAAGWAFEVVIMSGALCGVAMVLGSLFLLYRGAITLAQASQRDAVSVEFQKMLRINTSYPALGLFVVGLAFILGTAMVARRQDVPSLVLEGQLKAVDTTNGRVLVTVANDWRAPISTRGRFVRTLRPEAFPLQLTIEADGYSPFIHTLGPDDFRNGRAVLSEVELRRLLIETPAAPLPGLERSGAF